MKTNRNKQHHAAAAAGRVRASVKRLWHKIRIRNQGAYPDWMMHLPNPLPPPDEPEREA